MFVGYAAKAEAEGDHPAYDDLAVAHERLGQRDDAFAVMKRKLEALEGKPDQEHWYRYHATMYVLC